MSRAYYNENDPFAAAWLRELIKHNLIAQGDVDERSIEDVWADDVRGYTQCHWFAGIGGWSYALRLAGWPDDRPVWTGSCPCQPFSHAGKRAGTTDKRHLWPVWFNLIRECRPSVVFGEQVEAAIGHGWLDLVQSDMEGAGYAFAAHGLGACSVGAPHQRKRLYFVAHSEHTRFSGTGGTETVADSNQPEERVFERDCNRSVALPPLELLNRSGDAGESGRGKYTDGGELGHSHLPRSQGFIVGGNGSGERFAGETGVGSGMADSNGRIAGDGGLQSGGEHGFVEEDGSVGFWDSCDWIWCRDQKYRPVEPGTFPLAHGVSNRVGKLRGYGNAIVPQCAEALIRSYLDVVPAESTDHNI